MIVEGSTPIEYWHGMLVVLEVVHIVKVYEQYGLPKWIILRKLLLFKKNKAINLKQ